MKGDANPFDIVKLPFDHVSKAVKEERLAICMECEHLNDIGQCRMCGCFMPLKTRVPRASCPDGRWSAVTKEG